MLKKDRKTDSRFTQIFECHLSVMACLDFMPKILQKEKKKDNFDSV